MEENKREVLNNLYLIRAGLSYISTVKSDITEIEENVVLNRIQYNKKKDIYMKYQFMYNNKLASLNDRKEYYKEVEAKGINLMALISKTFMKKLPIFLFIGLTLTFILAFLYAFFIPSFSLPLTITSDMMVNIMANFSIFSLSLVTIMDLAFAFTSPKKAKKEFKINLETCKKEISYLQEQFDDIKNKLTKASEEFFEIRNKMEDLLTDDNYKKEIRYSVNKCKYIHQFIKKRCGDTVLEENWNLVDLMIYYISIGIAQNVKEVLYMAFNFNEDQLNDELIEANNFICSKLSDQALSQAMTKFSIVISASLNKYVVDDRNVNLQNKKLELYNAYKQKSIVNVKSLITDSEKVYSHKVI